jgi:hypothetical protein
MKLYKHWLGYDGMRKMFVADKQYDELIRYLKENKNARFKIYLRTDGDMFEKIIELECNEPYANLDLDCNSNSDKSLKRYGHKPSNIEPSPYLTQLLQKAL